MSVLSSDEAFKLPPGTYSCSLSRPEEKRKDYLQKHPKLNRHTLILSGEDIFSYHSGNLIGSGSSKKVYQVEGDDRVFSETEVSEDTVFEREGEELAFRLLSDCPWAERIEKIFSRLVNVKTGTVYQGMLKPFFPFTLECCLQKKEIDLSAEDEVVLSKDIISGLAWMHERKMYHGDFKDPNILVSSDHRAKITDFGFMVSVSDDSFRERSETHCFSPGYVPEEFLKLSADKWELLPESEKISLLAAKDNWGAGVILYLIGHFRREGYHCPVWPANWKDISDENRYEASLHHLKQISKESSFHPLLHMNPLKRSSLSEVLESPREDYQAGQKRFSSDP